VREREGIATPRPGKSLRRSWSKDRELHIRNVEAVGSNPITSTYLESPGQRTDGGTRKTTAPPRKASPVFTGL